MKSLYEYYGSQGVLPTEGGLETEDELRAHENERRRLFTDKLALPPQALRGARLLEIGPDVGGNALVFALWGVECTLSEPNLAAHARIEANFDRFGLRDRLVELLDRDVDGLPDPPDERAAFDLVDAEGFIYTVRPPARWIAKLARLVRPDGFAVVSYYASWGALIELLTKAVHARYCALTGSSGVEAAARLFGTKWDTIPHRRSIESWTMDVLENPFVRLGFFLDPAELCAEAALHGFRLHASWPRYEGGFDVHWFKHDPGTEAALERQRDFVARSRLSYLLGRSHFLVELDPGLGAELAALLAAVDSLVDGVEATAVETCLRALERVRALLGSPAVLSTTADREASRRTVDSVARLVELAAARSADELARFCNEDPAFLASWGSPAHFAAFRRERARY